MARPNPNTRYALAKYSGNGVQTDFNINFVGGWLHPEDLYAYTQDASDNITDLSLTILSSSESNGVTSGTVRVTPAPASGTTVYIVRLTQRANPLVDFVNKALLTPDNLNTITQQAIYSVAELEDSFRELTVSLSEYSDGIDDKIADVQQDVAASAAVSANALSVAQAAQTTANQAVASAATANNTAGNAVTIANNAVAAVAGANQAAADAAAAANAATTAANNATAIANSVNGQMQSTIASVNQAVDTANAAANNANLVSGEAQQAAQDAAEAKTAAQAAQTASADVTNKVSKSGDTMTGGLNVPALGVGPAAGLLHSINADGDVGVRAGPTASPVYYVFGKAGDFYVSNGGINAAGTVKGATFQPTGDMGFDYQLTTNRLMIHSDGTAVSIDSVNPANTTFDVLRFRGTGMLFNGTQIPMPSLATTWTASQTFSGGVYANGGPGVVAVASNGNNNNVQWFNTGSATGWFNSAASKDVFRYSLYNQHTSFQQQVAVVNGSAYPTGDTEYAFFAKGMYGGGYALQDNNASFPQTWVSYLSAGDYYLGVASSYGAAIAVKMYIRADGTIGVAGKLKAAGGVQYTSDRREKTALRKFTKARTERLRNIPIYTGRYKKSSGIDQHRRLFTIAQDITGILPEAVDHGDLNGKDRLSVDYGQIATAALALAQLAMDKCDALEKALNKLKEKKS